MVYALGVDGGGSKTLAVLGDESGTVLGIGRAGVGNHQASGLVAAMRQVSLAAGRALDMAGTNPAEVEFAYYCLAGADLPEDFELLRPALDALRLGGRFGLDNDTAAALRAGSNNPNAVLVGWGSGVNALGRNAAGREIRLAALGWYSGDWGGGADLGREAVRLVARARDGRGRPTALEGPVLRALGVDTVEAMIRKMYFHPETRIDIHCLAPLVFQAAGEGDPVARELVERSGEEVAATAVALLRRLDLLETPSDVVLAGSIFRAEGPLLIDTVRTRLREQATEARVVVPEVEPVIGAYFRALDMLGLAVDDELRRRASESYRAVAFSMKETR